MNTATKEKNTMKKTASLLFAAALACAVAAMTTGCRTSTRGFNPPSITATLSATNHVGAAISGGNQISAMLDKDAVLATYKDVAMQAAKSGTEMSLTSIGHGASKQPNVQRESKATEKLTNSLSSAIKAAKSGGDPKAIAAAVVDIGSGLVELSEEAANPPASDDTSLLGFDLKVGPGANLAGIAVAETLARTRIETVKAARSTYSRVSTTDTQESNTPSGIEAITGAMVELRKINSPAAVVGGSPKPGDKPEAETPTPAAPPGVGTGEPIADTPAARVAAMYPGMRLGGGNFDEKKMPDGSVVKGKAKPASERSLWKPDSDNSGDLVVVLPHSAMGRIISMTVGGETVAPDSIGNGWRPHLRFSKPGSAYSGPFTIKTSEGDWTGTAPGGKRTEPIPMRKASGPLSVSDLQAGAVSTPGE